MDDEKLYRIRRRIFRCVARIQRVAFDLRDIAEEELIPPTPEEYKKMESGEAPLTYHAHLTGMLNRIRFHVLEVGAIVEQHGRGLTPKTWKTRARRDPHILRSLGYAISHYHAEPSEASPEPGFKYWDERD